MTNVLAVPIACGESGNGWERDQDDAAGILSFFVLSDKMDPYLATASSRLFGNANAA
jgi:hypothetical protein